MKSALLPMARQKLGQVQAEAVCTSACRQTDGCLFAKRQRFSCVCRAGFLTCRVVFIVVSYSVAMSRQDLFHDACKNALIKAGWIITHDPFPLKRGRQTLFVDLGAEMLITAEREGRKIAVEIKSLVGRTEMPELERALGRYMLYRSVSGAKSRNAFFILRCQARRSQSILIPSKDAT